ncbi:GIY-YIG nuclease family protein [Paenibacillus sp. FSL H7-0940]|uniref:GIY-YIG nuclease family protein n=1 Tax=Paenibacillus sp. FSL H7-0940 TaxID=2921443 RepID=UPI0030EB7658
MINIELPRFDFDIDLGDMRRFVQTKSEYTHVQNGIATISEDYYKARRTLLSRLLGDVDKSRGGIYIFTSSDYHVYAGKSAKLFNRIEQHIRGAGGATTLYAHLLTHVRGFHVDDPYERDIYETFVIKEFLPVLNVAKKPGDVRITQLEANTVLTSH